MPVSLLEDCLQFPLAVFREVERATSAGLVLSLSASAKEETQQRVASSPSCNPRRMWGADAEARGTQSLLAPPCCAPLRLASQSVEPKQPLGSVSATGSSRQRKALPTSCSERLFQRLTPRQPSSRFSLIVFLSIPLSLLALCFFSLPC
ncbi:putative transmembrane protein [Toxoplasma gondii VAND]|uniref:Putative transmembrane protein n=1 Tax=Toxoplasma gondii VAND TaxID=933077 RepID=A0A086QH67_TOXGO|nr:putative transmembrane protein [Toxoplasma gondii VAND]